MISAVLLRLVLVILIQRIRLRRKVICLIVAHMLNTPGRRVRIRGAAREYDMISKLPDQWSHLDRLYKTTDSACLKNLRMDRNTFSRLCLLLKDLGGLKHHRWVSIEEHVSLFLSVLSHHKKQSVVAFDFQRSSQTVSLYVNLVLKAVLKLHTLFLSKPTPVPENSDNPRWKWCKGCLGALDGTHINVHVAAKDRGRFRNRKGNISTNVLGVCDRDMQFVYLLPGWEGSAADARVLRDAGTRPHGLKVPKGVKHQIIACITLLFGFPMGTLAMGKVNDEYGTRFSSDDAMARKAALERRFDCFHFLSDAPGMWLERETNRLIAEGDVWRYYMRRNRLTKAYYWQGEPEFESLALLFKRPTVPPTPPPTSNPTQSPPHMPSLAPANMSPRRGREVIVIPDDTPPRGHSFVEGPTLNITDNSGGSPMLGSRYPTARRLFDQLLSPPHDGASALRPQFPPPNFGPRLFLMWTYTLIQS